MTSLDLTGATEIRRGQRSDTETEGHPIHPYKRLIVDHFFDSVTGQWYEFVNVSPPPASTEFNWFRQKGGPVKPIGLPSRTEVPTVLRTL